MYLLQPYSCPYHTPTRRKPLGAQCFSLRKIINKSDFALPTSKGAALGAQCFSLRKIIKKSALN